MPSSCTIQSNPHSRALYSSAVLFLLSILPPVEAVEVDQLMRQMDRMWRGDTSQATLSMEVTTRHYKRSMKMEVWSKGKSHSLLVIRKPKKDRGIATLKAGKNIWNYLPKINRTTKIPASMMASAWMGSHFTNDDLIKESHYEDDFDSSLTFEGERDGQPIYEVTSTPKPDAAIVWGKIVMEIRQNPLTPIKALYYDEEGVQIRVIYFDQLSVVDGRELPMRITVIPEDKPEESTVIHYHDITFDIPLDEQHFSLRNLRQQR